MFTNPKYLDEALQTQNSKKYREQHLQSYRLSDKNQTTKEDLQALPNDFFAWYSTREWFELKERLQDFTISQMNHLFTAQKLKLIPIETIENLIQHLETERTHELQEFGTMEITRWLRDHSVLKLGQVTVNIMETLREAIESSKQWYAHRDKNELLAQQDIMADEEHVFVDVLMARWKLDRKTVDKYFRVKRLLGYNVIPYQEVLAFAKDAFRPQASFSKVTGRPKLQDEDTLGRNVTEFDYLPQTENLWLERTENQHEYLCNGNFFIETLYDTKDIIDKINDSDEFASQIDNLFIESEENPEHLIKVTDVLPFFKADMDKRSFERHVKLGYYEHYRIGIQYRLSLRQIRESALYIKDYYKNLQGNLQKRMWETIKK